MGAFTLPNVGTYEINATLPGANIGTPVIVIGLDDIDGTTELPQTQTGSYIYSNFWYVSTNAKNSIITIRVPKESVDEIVFGNPGDPPVNLILLIRRIA
jgi:hypothetical protein